MSKISKNIKQLRQERGMTQDELAERLFVTRQAISSWENDRTQPDVQMLGKLREVFGVSVEELLYGKKRDTTLETAKPTYTSSLITVFSVLGSILVTAGLILIFITGWERVPELLKKLFAFLPLLMGQGAGVFVLMKKREQKAWCEAGAVFWSIGIIVTCFLVDGVFSPFLYHNYYYLIMTLSLLPVVLLMRSVCALTAFYFVSFFQVSVFVEGVIFSSFGALKYILCGLCALLIPSVGIYLARITEAADKESLRVRIIYLITAVAIPAYAFFFIIYGNFSNGNGVLFVSAILLSYFILGQADKSFAPPFRFLGFFGIAGCICLSSYISLIDLRYSFGAGSVVLIAVQLIIICTALYFIKGRFASRLQGAMSFSYLAAHFLFLLLLIFENPCPDADSPEEMMLIYEIFSRWKDIIFVILQIFALCFFSLLIAQGAMDKKLTVMNTGFIGFTHQVVFWVSASGIGMLANGILLLICGGVLLFINLKIASSKRNGKDPLLVNTSKEVGADEK